MLADSEKSNSYPCNLIRFKEKINCRRTGKKLDNQETLLLLGNQSLNFICHDLLIKDTIDSWLST